MLIALDVGFANTGWCAFDGGKPIDCGCIKTKKNELGLSKSKFRVADDNVRRSQGLAAGLIEVINKYKPQAIIGELPTGGAQSASAATQMAMATAVVAVVVSMREIKHAWSTPLAGKKALTGLRGAEKDQMMDAVRALYPDFQWPKFKNRFEHIADAVASYHALKEHELVVSFG